MEAPKVKNILSLVVLQAKLWLENGPNLQAEDNFFS